MEHNVQGGFPVGYPPCSLLPVRWPNRKWQFCHIEGGYKVYDRGTGQTAEIYDRANDPKEKVNLIDEIPMASELLASTAALREKHRQLSSTFGEPQYIGTDQGTVEELRSLGYL